MPVDIYDREFQNWLKGVLALNTTRDRLCEIFKEILKTFITNLPEKQKSHLKLFLNCLDNNGIKQLKQRKHLKRNNIKHGCEHDQCKHLFDKFFKLHEEERKLNYTWECKNANTKGICSGQCQGTEDEIEEGDVWRITMLYMVEDAQETGNYKRFDDLDISNVIKTMRSCILCVRDGSLKFYEEVLLFRNKYMHSPNNKISEDDLKKEIESAINLLKTIGQSDGKKTSMCQDCMKEAIQYLKKLGENDFAITYKSEEYKLVVTEAKKALTIVVDLPHFIDDSKEEGTGKVKVKRIQDILENICKVDAKDVNQQLEYKTSDFKSLVKHCIENKKESIEYDKTVVEQGSDQTIDRNALATLQQQIETDLTDINEQLRKTDDEEVADLIDHLNKEVTTLKTERENNLKEVRTLKTERENNLKEVRTLKEETEEKKIKLKMYCDERERYRNELDTLKSKKENNGAIEGVSYSVYGKQPSPIYDQEGNSKAYRPDFSESIRFYMREIPMKPDGCNIDQIHVEWWEDYVLLERHRGYIRWLFPNKESGLNRRAKEEQLQQVKEIKSKRIAKKRILTSYKMMLGFYGMVLENEEDGSIRRADNWRERFGHLNKSSHNYPRITRILKCIGEFGYEYLKKNFVKFVLYEGFVKATLANLEDSCVKYWIGVLREDRDREEMTDYYQRLASARSLV